MGKIGLVVEGGGMKCAYSAGVLDAFLDNGIKFDYCIGVSAGSANTASYLAGQRGRNLRFYTAHIGSPDYFGAKSYLHTGNLFGLDYIYGTLSNSDGIDALDYDKVMANPSEFVIVATNAETGRAKYFKKNELKRDDYDIIKASCALPAACHPVEVNGRFYYDGGVSDSIPVKRAFYDGCDKVVVIMSKNRDFIKKPEKMRGFYTIACRRYPKIIRLLNQRHIRYTKSQQYAYRMEEEGKAFVFAPSKHLAMSTYAMDADANKKLYDLGLTDFQAAADRLGEFMKN